MDGAIRRGAFLFAGWRFDPLDSGLSRREASGAWRSVPLGSRALGILALLLEQRGRLVSKDRIMAAVWPSTVVEPNNLTVQIAALRRVLDEGQQGDSLIQTIPGRGYRLVCDVEAEMGGSARADGGASELTEAAGRDRPVRGVAGRRVGVAVAGMAVLVVLVVAAAGIWVGRWHGTAAPRVAVAVVPFVDLSDGADSGRLAEALTADVATELARWQWRSGILSNVATARREQGGAADASLREMGTRYAVQGTVRRSGGTVHVNAQVLDTASGTPFWSDTFDFGAMDAAAAEREAVRRIVEMSGRAILKADIERRQRLRPDQPNATDLALQARRLELLPPSAGRLADVRELYERALRLDPSSITVKISLADGLMDGEDFDPSGFKTALERVRGLLADIRTQLPESQPALTLYARWLIWQEDRCPEAIEASRHLVETYPDASQGGRWLGRCLAVSGRAEEALPWLERSIRLSGAQDPWQFSNFRNMGLALLYLGRYAEAVAWFQRGLAANPDDNKGSQAWRISRIAIAQALDGHVDEARQTMVRALALWPYFTVRGEFPGDTRSAVSLAQTERMREGLRLAGLRDRADEDADFGVPPIDALRQASTGPTSLTIAGATTVRTADVARLVAGHEALIIDAMSQFGGRSIPGAVGLRYVGAGGALTDLAQDRLRLIMRKLTGGDLSAPVLAVGWNSEHFDGTNLVVRLVALGYRNVFWYRGGREPWEASGALETPLVIQDW